MRVKAKAKAKQGKKQIPEGNDRKNGKGKCNFRGSSLRSG
jgi:hypothetical protein